MNKREEIIEAAAEQVRIATREVVDGKYNTTNIRNAANLLIDLRLEYFDKHGNVDLMGNSYSYRKAVAEIMSRANVAGDERARVMNAIRYHIGNSIRDRFSAEELKEMGFHELSPLERQKIDREQKARVLRTATVPEEMITDPNEVIAALRSAANLLDNIEMTEFSAVEVKMASVMLEHLRHRLSELRASTRA